MNVFLIGAGAVAGLLVGWLVGRSAVNSARRQAEELTMQRDDAVATSAKLQRAADERKAALAAAKAAEDGLVESRRVAEAANAERDEIAAALAAAETRFTKAVSDYRGEIADRDHTIAEQRERLKTADRAAEKLGTTGEAHGVATAPAARAADPGATEKRVTSLERELGEAKKALETVTREREESRTASKRLQSRMRELNRTQELLNAKFADKNHRIAELEGRLAGQNGGGSSAEAGSAMAGAPALRPTIDELDEKGANDHLVRAYRHDMAAKNREINALKDELSKREKSFRRLKDKLKASEKASVKASEKPAERGAQPSEAPEVVADGAEDRPVG